MRFPTSTPFRDRVNRTTARGVMAKRGVVRLLVLSLVATAVFAAPAQPQADADVQAFDDGTEIEITIETPVDGASPIAGAIDVAGTARVGAGDTPRDTVLVGVFDLSGSTRASAGGDCGGNLNSSGGANQIVDCEIAALIALEQSAIELGSVRSMGLVGFDGAAVRADVTPDDGQYIWLTEPGADLNNNGETDISEVARSARPWNFSSARLLQFRELVMGGGGTNYAAGLEAACVVMDSVSSPNRIIVFLSDGEATFGANVSTALPCAQETTVYSVAVGSGSNCADDPRGRGSLQDVADLGGGTCTEIINPADLPEFLGGIIAPEIFRLGVSVNGGPEVDISDSASVTLPAKGPDPISWATTVEGLAGPQDEICVTVYGRIGDEVTTATECRIVGGNQPPTAVVGDDQLVVEGALVSIDGTSSFDPDGDPLTYEWAATAVSGQPPLLTSTTEPVASFLALDDGVIELSLTVSDGRDSSTDTMLVTVQNAAPVAAAQAEPASEGGIALITASFTDAGLLDTHTATIDWGDGTGAVPVAVSAQGNGWGSLYGTHTYASTGSYAATITIIDDDGGVATAQTISVDVQASLALWANGSGGINLGGGGGTIEGLVHTNGDLRARGASKVINGPVEIVGDEDTRNLTVNGSVTQVGASPVPVSFDFGDYQPGGRAAIDAGPNYFDMSDECGRRWDPSGPLSPGLYFVPCDVKLNSSALSGEITIVSSGDIQVSGGGANFRPFIDGLLFFSNSGGNKALQASVSSSTFLGYLYAPFGAADLAGSGPD